MKRAVLLALVMMVAACDGQTDSPAEQRGEASGEVLGGTISDDMIPLEQLRSEAPLVPRRSAAPAAAGADDGAEGEDPASEGAEAAPAAPAPEPVPEE